VIILKRKMITFPLDMALPAVFAGIAALISLILSLIILLRRRQSPRKLSQPVTHASRFTCEVCNAVFDDEALYRRHSESFLCTAKRGASNSQHLSTQAQATGSETVTSAYSPSVGTNLIKDDDTAGNEQ